MAAWTTGAPLGPYVLLAPIGAGGMGEVWKARDTRLDRIVAIKTSKEQFSERFEREARAVAALNHPHICQLYDVGPNYLVMEFIDGAPLKGPLPLEKAVEFAGQILEALDAAHRKGITHRDLKPANILVTRQGIKLLDFGLAKQSGPLQQTDATLTEALTQRGVIVGTLQYMSPEQLQGKETDARSDLFAFGCILYEMLTGKLAFEGESAASVIAAILEREPAPLTAAPPLERVVRRALAKDPDQRFQTARDLKIALTWAMEQRPPSAAARPPRRWWIAASALAVGIFLAGWGVSHFRQPLADDRVFRLDIVPPEGGQFTFGVVTGGFALSPDGRTVAFVASADGRTGLWVRPLDSTMARLIAGTESGGFPFWSPDGKSLGFFTASQLKRVDLAGGTPSVICGTASGRGGAWTSDGRILFGTPSSGLFQVSADGGTPSSLTTPDASLGEFSHRWPQVLPGGRFLYLAPSRKAGNVGSIYAGLLAKPGEGRRLLSAETNALYAPGGNGKDYLLWMRGGTLVAQEFDPGTFQLAGEPRMVADPVAANGLSGRMNVAAAATGVLMYSASNTLSQLTWFDRGGNNVGVVGDPGEYSMLRLSPNGRRVVVARERAGVPDLWLLDVERHVSSKLNSSGSNMYPVWSPDGRTIVFSSTAGLFRKDSSGAGNEQRLSQSHTGQFGSDWSRDGRLVLYEELSPEGGRDLWVIEVTSEGSPAGTSRAYLRTPANERHGRFSPESPPRWVAYQSDETGRNEIYIQAFPEPRGPIPISTGGGQYPAWGAGGQELFYVSPDNKLMAVRLKLGANSVEPSTPRVLFSLSAVDNEIPPYDVAPDGRFLVRATTGQAGKPLTVIVNWPALLKKGAGAP
jgi:eukaryotic-like serine/threonine-protein kinase